MAEQEGNDQSVLPTSTLPTLSRRPDDFNSEQTAVAVESDAVAETDTGEVNMNDWEEITHQEYGIPYYHNKVRTRTRTRHCHHMVAHNYHHCSHCDCCHVC